MIDILIIAYMGVMAAWSGGSLWPSRYLHNRLTWLPEAFFSLGFIIPWLCLSGLYMLLWPVIMLWSYGWMQSATANGLHWGEGKYKKTRDTSFSPVVNRISEYMKIDKSSVQYCRLYMAVKGFLITLPAGGSGLLFWPLGYEAGQRLGSNTWREFLAGAGAGLGICIFKRLI